jgi:PKD repeat protein
LTEEPASLEVTLDLGETTTQQLTLNNTGVAEGTFAVSDSDKGYTPKMAQKPLVPSGNPVVVTGASTNSPVQLFKSRINANDILLISTTDVSQSVERALNELGYAYDYFAGSPWTGIDFTPYNTVLVAMDGGLAEDADIAKLRTDVIDEGKKLIFLGGTCYQPFAVAMNTYLVQNDTNNYCWEITGSPNWTLVDSTHPLADGLPDSHNYANSSAGYYSIRVTDPDAEQVAVNGENWPAFFRKATDGDFIWFIDSVYSSYWADANDFALLKQLISNSIEVTGGGDALWLTEDPLAGVVAPDTGTQVITVTFDASVVTQPGTYMAEIKIKTNDPVASKFVIPAVMNVNGPPNMGRVEGIVTSLGYCDQNPVPLKGAMVEIVGGPTLETDAAGHYSSWLVEGTYTVNVTAEGHVATTAEVVVVAQETTTQDFDLRSIQPCVSTDPTSFEVNVAEGFTQTVPLVLINTGAGDTAFKIAEKEGALLNVEAYQPPALSDVVALGLEQSSGGKPNVTGVRKTFVPNGEIILDQAPNQSNGIFSDASCDLCGGPQVLAENFMVDQSVAVGQVIFWTGYYPGDVPIDPDHIKVIFHYDSGGLPGTAIYTEADVESERVQTGVMLFGVHEYMNTLTLAEPVFLDPGNYWVELYNDTGWGTDDFFWEAGNGDPVYGLDGNGWSLAAPGESWMYEAGDLAIQLITADLDVPWLSENPITGTLAADSVFNIDVTFDTMTFTVGTTVTATLVAKTQDAEQPTINIPVVMHVVAPTAPVASFTSTSPVMIGDVMVFTNTSEPGNPAADEYNWDFGDGITLTVPTTEPVFHTYTSVGTFTVTLEACNVVGCNTSTAEVVVMPFQFFLPLANKN